MTAAPPGADAELVLTRVKVSGLNAIPPSGVGLGPTGVGKSSVLEAVAGIEILSSRRGATESYS